MYMYIQLCTTSESEGLKLILRSSAEKKGTEVIWSSINDPDEVMLCVSDILKEYQDQNFLLELT